MKQIQDSEKYYSLRNQTGSFYEVRVVRIVNNGTNVIYGMDKLRSLEINQALFHDSGPQIGGVCSAKCNLKLVEDSENWPRMAAFQVQIRLSQAEQVDPAETDKTNWITLGTFYTDERKAISGKLDIVAYDGMMMLEDSWTDKVQNLPNNWPITATAAVSLISEATGFQVDNRSVLDNTTAFIGLDNTSTAREVLSTVAAGLGGNWTMTSEGKLLLVSFSSLIERPNAIVGIAVVGRTIVGTQPMSGDEADQLERTDNLGMSVMSFDAGTNIGPIDGVLLTTDSGVKARAGTGNTYTLSADCNFANNNAAILCLSRVQGYEYRPFTARGARLNPLAEIGDFVKINNVVYPLITVTWKLGKHITADISAPYDESVDHEYPMLSESAKTLRKAKGYADARIYDETSTLRSEFNVDAGSIRARVESIARDEVNELLEQAAAEFNIDTEVISAKVDKVYGDENDSFSWSLTANSHTWYNNGHEVMSVDGNGLKVKGHIEAVTGYIGTSSQGFAIDSRSIKNTLTGMDDTNHTIGVYLGTDGIKLGQTFSVTQRGFLTATEGQIADFNIKPGRIYSGKEYYSDLIHAGVYLGTNGIAVGSDERHHFSVSQSGSIQLHYGMTTLDDTTASGMYIGTNGIALGGGNFKVTSGGVITAKNGTVGGFTISSNAIYTSGQSSYSGTGDGIYLGTSGIRLGDAFKVTNAGTVTASNVNITGGSITINSKFTDESTGRETTKQIFSVSSSGRLYADFTEGSLTITAGDKFRLTGDSLRIGGFTIGNNSIYSNQKEEYSDTSTGVHLSADGIRLGSNFRVDSEGNLTANSGTFGGTVYADHIQGYVSEQQLNEAVQNVLNYARHYNNATQTHGSQNFSSPSQFTANGIYGNFLFAKADPTSSNGAYYSVKDHTHAFTVGNDGKIHIQSADLTGADHFFNIADTQYFKDAVSAASSGSVDDVKANYISYNPSSPAGYLNGLIASTNGYKTSGNNKYVQAIFDITAGHQISGSTETAYDFQSNNRVFNVDITDIYNEAHNLGRISVDTISKTGYELLESGATDYTKFWVRLENDKYIHDIDVSDAYNAGVTSGGGGTITSLTIQSARNYSGTYIVNHSSSRQSSSNTNTFMATTNLLVNGSSIGDLSVDITGITEDLYLYGFQPTINSFDSSNNRLYIRSNYELRLKQDNGGYQKIIDYYDGSTNNYVDISSYIGGSGVSIGDVTISAANQASYSTSADASVSLDYDYVRYNSSLKKLKGRASITLSDGSNTTTKTLFIAMDANKVIEAEGGSSIVDAARVQSVEPTSYSASAYEELVTFSNTNQLRYVNGYLQGRAIITLSNNEKTRLLIKMDGDLASGSSVDRTITSSSYPNNDYTRLTVDFTTGSSQEIDLPYVGNKTLYQYAYDLGYNASPGDSSSSVTVSDITSTYNSGEWDYSVEISRNKTSYSNGYLYGYVNVTLSNDRTYTVQVEMNASKASSSSSVTITHTASLYVQYMGIHRISGVNFYQHAVTPYSNVNDEYEVAGNTFYVDLTYQAEDGFYGNQSQTITL